MADVPTVWYVCTKDPFRPEIKHPVRWLDWEEDYAIARKRWTSLDSEAFREMWSGARKEGYEFAAVVDGEKLVAIAAVYRYSETHWMLAAVSTDDAADRRQGYAKSVCSFVTAHVLEAGRTATCCTRADNIAMQRTAESIGFRRK